MGKVEMVKPEAIIDVKIGSQFLKDLQATLIFLTTLESAEKLQEAVNKGNAQQTLSDWENAVYTMLVLVTTAEENARKEGLTTVEEIPETDLSPEEPQSQD